MSITMWEPSPKNDGAIKSSLWLLNQQYNTPRLSVLQVEFPLILIKRKKEIKNLIKYLFFE